MVRFFGFAEKRTTSPPFLRERSERKTSVFNQKNDVFRLCPLLNYLDMCILLTQQQEKRWFIFRLRRKMNHNPLLRERSERVVNNYEEIIVIKKN
ncbi:MAG: hypothetical protein U5L45_24905 [Saprospiraceae bacterium]|nr:hypothetical protein [Saprospiraceae bacterium]